MSAFLQRGWCHPRFCERLKWQRAVVPLVRTVVWCDAALVVLRGGPSRFGSQDEIRLQVHCLHCFACRSGANVLTSD
jgi:hypothetical protein